MRIVWLLLKKFKYICWLSKLVYKFDDMGNIKMEDERKIIKLFLFVIYKKVECNLWGSIVIVFGIVVLFKWGFSVFILCKLFGF